MHNVIRVSRELSLFFLVHLDVHKLTLIASLKDSHLYAYLVTTRQGSSGPCLVFCNSIAAVRRVGETLKMLGLPVKMLHAQMPQVSIVQFSSDHFCLLYVFGSDEENKARESSGITRQDVHNFNGPNVYLICLWV